MSAPDELTSKAAKVMLAAVAATGAEQVAVKLFDGVNVCLVVVTRAPAATALLQAYLDEQQHSGTSKTTKEWPLTQ